MKWLALIVLSALLGGCGGAGGSTLQQRQDAARADPFSYSPYENDRRTVTGGGLTEFDSNAFKKDLKDVFNP